MHSGQIKYETRPRFGRPKEKVLTFECIEDWDELSKEQIEVLTRLILTEMHEYEKKTILFHSLSTIPKKIFVLLNTIQLVNLCEVVDPFFEEPELTVNLWPSFRLGCTTYYGPSNFFGNLTVDEFIESEDYYFDYLEEMREPYPDDAKMEELLNQLVATLWREKDKAKDPNGSDFNGDWRVAFNQHQVKARAKKLAKLPAYRKLGMLFYYQGCRTALVDLHTAIFNSSEGNEESADRESWIKMIGHLPNDKFGTLDRIGPMNLQTTLYFCNLFILEAKKRKKSGG